MTQQRKKCGKGGFTLVELVVTLVILSILFAIAVPNLLGYIHLSQFRRNESCAKTMYLSAESALTYCRTGGEWESFCRRVKDEGVLNRSFDEADGEQKKLSGRIYGIRLDADEYASGELSGDGSLVDELLSQDTYDKSLLNAAICIEIDVESGHVYSVFYGTNCKGLYYGSNALSQPAELSGEWLDMDGRASYDLRRAERLGYYSVQDAVNVVNLDAAKLKITSINLVNGETLSLGWSSSVKAQNRANVYYEVKLYSSADEARLLTIRVPGSALKTGAQPLEVTAEDGTKKNYTFPLEYDRTAGRASLVLDGMMNGNIAIPAVRMMQARVSEENRNAQAPLSALVETTVSSGNTTPRAGTAHSAGILLKFTIHAPASRTTSLVSGLDGPVWSITDFTT